ncbi:hypothetical protein [Paraflavitalea pollutisoli]|uniref:hypothetical protein n=1 Tax=Paraflavitalea pollutisoli TaxID=3034143 RepID=UPI0023EA928C|nr:hypothetical protein [Paraflavitalea sp. H1-2-19X]
MKPKRLLRISVAIIGILVIGTSFLTPPRHHTRRGGGTFVIEYKGKQYVCTKRDGSAMLSADNKAMLYFSGEHLAGKRSFRLQFNFHPLATFKPGKYILTTQEKQMDQHQQDGCVLVSFVTLAEDGNDPGEQNPADLAGDSETGNVTLTNIVVNAADHSALLTGTYEFTGTNAADYATDKKFSVKGSFKNFEVSYANLSRP